jgi:pyridoxine kinase
MGDNGKLYPAFNEHYAKKNADLCAVADIADPNITEAAFLTGLPYRETYEEEYVRELLLALAALGTKTPILTGVSLSEGKTGVMGYDSEKDEFCSYYNENLPVKFHGTGDVFASTMCGALALGHGLEYSIRVAVDYTVECIKKSIGDDEHKYGVRFEECIGYLTEYLKGE